MSVIRAAYAWVILTSALCMVACGAWMWWTPAGEAHRLMAGVLGLIALNALVTVGGLITLIQWARAPIADFQAQIRALSERQFIELKEPRVSEWITLSKALNVMVARVQMMLAERDESLNRMKHKAAHDALTQLASRQHLMEQAAQAVLHEGPGGAFAIFRLQDLDGLNKRLGRQRADDLLVAVATALNARLLLDRRAADTAVLARLNGSEFGLLMPGFAQDQVLPLLKSMAKAMNQLSVDGLADTPAVVRVGATLFRAGEEVSDVMLRTDMAVNQAEFEQQALVVTEPSAKHHTIAVAQWRVIIETALDNGHLKVDLYPVASSQGELLHQEAFLRLTEPNGDTYDAGAFLPPALRSGRSMELDLRAVQLSLAEIERGGQAVAVNIALQSAMHPMFMRRLETLLTQAPQAARQLWLELRDPDVATLALPSLSALGSLLHRHGARFGLDNVGWTFSLRQVIDIHGLDYLKLSPELCRHVSVNGSASALVEVLVPWAQRTRCKLIACGVDDEATYQALHALGVQLFSGRHVRLPAPAQLETA